VTATAAATAMQSPPNVVTAAEVAVTESTQTIVAPTPSVTVATEPPRVKTPKMKAATMTLGPTAIEVKNQLMLYTNAPLSERATEENPTLTNLKTAMQDLQYWPSRDLVESDPAEFFSAVSEQVRRIDKVFIINQLERFLNDLAPYNAMEACTVLDCSFQWIKDNENIPNPSRNKEWTELLLYKVLKEKMNVSKRHWAYFRKLASKGRFVKQCLKVFLF
jgi:hypothetical protein